MVPNILLETGNFYQTLTRKSGQVVKLKEMAVKCTHNTDVLAAGGHKH